jgi:hypothetical protein
VLISSAQRRKLLADILKELEAQKTQIKREEKGFILGGNIKQV